MSAVIFAITIIGIITYAIILTFIVIRLLLLFIQDAKPKKAHRDLPPYSVVVPFRNEEDNLPALLWALLRQRHKPERIILVNDNSTDNFQDVLRPFLKAFPFIEFINNSGSGKKQALKEGIERAPTQWVAITDADSMPHSEWAYGMLAYGQKENLDLIGGMVVGGGKSFAEVLGTIDLIAQLSLSCITKQNPVTISASSLFIKKNVWQAVKPEWLEVPSVSGDDVFMLYIAQREGFKTGFYCGRESAVTTQMPQSIGELIWQRTRWASKIIYYRNAKPLMILGFVVLLSIMHILAMATINLWFLLPKVVIDLVFLASLTLPYTYFHWFRYLPLISLGYPIFVLIIGINSLFERKQWNTK